MPFTLEADSWGQCTYTIANKTTAPFPSGIKISLDPNAPVGTVFYDSLIPSLGNGSYHCPSQISKHTRRGSFSIIGGGATVTMSGHGIADASYAIYKTNIDGLGVLVRYGNRAVPYDFPSGTNIYNSKDEFVASSVFDMDLIKYADIPLGAKQVVISSAVLPTVRYSANIVNSSNTIILPNGKIPMVDINFSSVTIDILTATCDAPLAVNVNLGSWNVHNTQLREGGKFATPWVDASINLTNCPVFYGTGNRGNGNTRLDNTMTLTLVPANVTTSAQGIMPVDSHGAAAQGADIQLAYGTAASNSKVNFSTGQATSSYTMSSTQGPAYSIPLVARYFQTATNISDVKGGLADGKVTYRIDYH